MRTSLQLKKAADAVPVLVQSLARRAFSKAALSFVPALSPWN